MNGPLRSILPVSPSQLPKEMGCDRIIACSGFVLNRIPPLFYTPAAFGEARSKPVRGRPAAIRPNTCGWQRIVDYFAFVDYPVYTIKASLLPLATWNFPCDSVEQGTPCGVSWTYLVTRLMVLMKTKGLGLTLHLETGSWERPVLQSEIP